MNLTDLPDDVKLLIFHINKDIDKHNKLLNHTLNELNYVFDISNKYFKYIKECIGISVWEHFSDYDYWINLEKDDYLQKYPIKYFKNKSFIVKYIINSKFSI